MIPKSSTDIAAWLKATERQVRRAGPAKCVSIRRRLNAEIDLGFSNWSAWKVAAALEIQKANGFAPFTHGQMYYSLLGRDVERDVIPMMRRCGLGMTVWSPLASGFLSDKYSRENLSDPANRYSGFDILPFDKEHGFKLESD